MSAPGAVHRLISPLSGQAQTLRLAYRFTSV